MVTFDEILYVHKERLSADVGIDAQYLSKVSTTIRNELSLLTDEQLLEIEKSSLVPLEDRIQELGRFDELIHYVIDNQKSISGNRKACITTYRNYMLFVYLKDNCFEVTKKLMPSKTMTKRICRFLLDNPLRAFRNAIAHGNFYYNIKNTQSIIFYAYKGESKDNVDASEMTMFEVYLDELNFWQELSRGTAYTIYGFIVDRKAK